MDPIATDSSDFAVSANNQDWRVAWYPPPDPPPGTPHGAAAVCVTGDRVVLVSNDGQRWGLPGGRPEPNERWVDTLRREVREEACVRVTSCRLLGFTRGVCVRGPQEGLVLVRSLWRAEVRLKRWEPRFEMAHRRLVPAEEALELLTIAETAMGPFYRRMFVEAGILERSTFPQLEVGLMLPDILREDAIMRDAYTSPHPQARISVAGADIAYVDAGPKEGRPVVFLHGNPTSSYLWRNIIPHVSGTHRCLAPDLAGMGNSGPMPRDGYRFADHRKVVDAWFEAMGLTHDVTLVIHDWGSALGFDWTRRHPERVSAIVYMEAITAPRLWSDWPEGRDKLFRRLRSEEGESLVFDDNVFVERVLPKSILRPLSDAEMEAYRGPFRTRESRLPTLVWPREIPIEGEPADVAAAVEAYRGFMAKTPIRKLFVNAEPGAITIGRWREICRAWPNQTEVTVKGKHFVQEDSPEEIGRAFAAFLA